MVVTRETEVRDIVEEYPEIKEVFLEHGVDIDAECSDDVQSLDLEFCEAACHVDDIDALIEDLNTWIQRAESGGEE